MKVKLIFVLWAALMLVFAFVACNSDKGTSTDRSVGIRNAVDSITIPDTLLGGEERIRDKAPVAIEEEEAPTATVEEEVLVPIANEPATVDKNKGKGKNKTK